MTSQSAVPQIIRCYHHQYPEDFGREPVTIPFGVYPSGHQERAEGFSQWPVSEQCDRCGCNHGAGTVYEYPHGTAS